MLKSSNNYLYQIYKGTTGIRDYEIVGEDNFPINLTDCSRIGSNVLLVEVNKHIQPKSEYTQLSEIWSSNKLLKIKVDLSGYQTTIDVDCVDAVFCIRKKTSVKLNNLLFRLSSIKHRKVTLELTFQSPVSLNDTLRLTVEHLKEQRSGQLLQPVDLMKEQIITNYLSGTVYLNGDHVTVTVNPKGAYNDLYLVGLPDDVCEILVNWDDQTIVPDTRMIRPGVHALHLANGSHISCDSIQLTIRFQSKHELDFKVLIPCGDLIRYCEGMVGPALSYDFNVTTRME